MEKCPEGWDPAELFAYIEGDLPPDTRRELEQHLVVCSACSRELESLRHLDGVLRANPWCFHPDEEDLFRFVSGAEDVGGHVSAHLQTCEECKEAVAVLREMVAVGPQYSPPRQTLPGPLLQHLKARQQAAGSRAERSNWLASVLELFRKPFNAPMLALGTVAAVLVLVAVLVPSWTTFKGVPPSGDVSLRDKAPAPQAVEEKRTADEQPDAPSYKFKPAEPRAPEESPPPAVESAPAAPAAPVPTPARRPPEVKKGELRKLKSFTVAPPASKPNAAPHAERATRGYLDAELEQKVLPPAKPLSKTRVDGLVPGLAQEKETRGEHRPTVVVRIVAPAGPEAAGLRFVPSLELAAKYDFSTQIGTEEEPAEKQADTLRSAVLAPAEEAHRVTIKITQAGSLYSLEGTISDPRGLRPGKELSKPDVAPGDLQAEITAMVSSLLSGH
ncbi:MAG: zf-HC2 domain-containing protein [Desulfomonile tiedjei]|nr:zf-HC2 domain-containing protein [Desulfomonile tiedjei]